MDNIDKLISEIGEEKKQRNYAVFIVLIMVLVILIILYYPHPSNHNLTVHGIDYNKINYYNNTLELFYNESYFLELKHAYLSGKNANCYQPDTGEPRIVCTDMPQEFNLTISVMLYPDIINITVIRTQ